MSTPGFVPVPPELLTEFESIVGADNIVVSGKNLDTLSKDFYWYSPVLSKRIGDRLAAVALKVSNLDQLTAIVSIAAMSDIPITPRGGATGNYGQAVPLYGGLVIDLTAIDKIISIEDGVVTAEPGARLVTIENEARPLGWELRCYPSTWVKSTLAGFLGGGSGGIGSVGWGGLREPGTIKRFKVMTVEETPRIITIDEEDCLKVFHAYGTNGIIVEVQLRLAPAVPWQQLVVASEDWDAILDFAAEIGDDPDVRKRLVTVLENPIGAFFKPIKRFYPEDHHLIFFEVDEAVADAVVTRAESAGLQVTHRIPYHFPRKPPMLSDYTWNHTTLWAIKSDPSWTYLQSGFGENYREQFQLLHKKFPGEILFHLELTRGKAKPEGGHHVAFGGIPIVKFSTEERLREMIEYSHEIGVGVANPHTCYIEEGGRDQGYDIQLDLKAETDPKNLLNPGKMKQAPAPAFATPGAMPQFLFS